MFDKEAITSLTVLIGKVSFDREFPLLALEFTIEGVEDVGIFHLVEDPFPKDSL